MRICYYADGRYVHAERWMRFFVEKGHEMHLISFAPVSDERAVELGKLGVKYHGSTGNFHIKKPWLTCRDLRFIRSVLAKERIEILHSHFLGTNIWFAYLSGFHPHVITVMGGDVVGDSWSPNANIQDRLFTARSLRSADSVTAWSRSLARRISPYLRPGVKPVVIHGGVELERFEDGEPSVELKRELDIPDKGQTVFSSRLVRRLYNIEEISLAADLVCRQIPSAYFLIALPEQILDEEYLQIVRSNFEQGAARNNVRFVPGISHDKIPDYYRATDVVVSIPSTDGTPMTVLEAMACGTPTVIGNLPDYDAEYFEDGKTTVMVDVNAPRSIADGILKILSNDVLRTEISQEARRRIQETGHYEYQMSKMEDIYKSLVR